MKSLIDKLKCFLGVHVNHTEIEYGTTFYKGVYYHSVCCMRCGQFLGYKEKK